MKVVITGVSGFVGTNLSSYLLNSGYEVCSLSLRGPLWKNDFPHVADALIHLAGKAHDTANSTEDTEYFRINKELTIELFQYFLQSNIRDFFYFSSVKAVADTVENILDEDIVGNPITAYGISKYEAEQYLLAQKMPANKRLFIVRPCMIHGPGNKGNLNLLYKIVQKGFPWPLASFENQRSFLNIDNLNYLIEQMIVTEELKSGIYNLADDESLSTNDLVTLIAEVLGLKKKLWHIPISFVQLVVKLGDIIPFPLNSERLKKLTESYVVSNNKIKKSLGLKELPFSVEKGLRKTIQSFKNK